MKKKLFCTICVSLCSMVFFSCGLFTLATPKSEFYGAPVVNAQTSGVQVTPTYMAGIKYINVFRYDDDGSGKPINGINICQVIPADDYKSSLVITDGTTVSSNDYIYRIRYALASGYVYSEYSASVTATGGSTTLSATGTINVTYSDDTGTLSFDKSDLTLTASLQPQIAITNIGSGVTKVYDLTDASSSYVIYLRSVLPESFYNTNLKIEAILGAKKDTSEPNYTTIFWTKPLTTVTCTADPLVVKNVSGTAESYDYSDKGRSVAGNNTEYKHAIPYDYY